MKKNLILLFAFLCMGSMVFAQRTATASQAKEQSSLKGYTPSSSLANCGDGQFEVTNANFTGQFDFANATTDAPGGSSIALDGNTGFTLTSDDTGGGVPLLTSVCWTLTEDSNISFDWAFTTIDPGFEFMGFLVNGVGFLLADADGSGTQDVSLLAGDEICIAVETFDGLFGPGEGTISNFSYTACGDLVPTMTQWGLFLFGMSMVTLGLVFVYNKQRQIA